MIPHQYRTVAFTDVEVDLDEQSLRDFFCSRQVYRRTRFVVARRGVEIAVVELVKTAEEDLFVDVAQVRMLARPDETILVVRPDIDTAVPSQLARVAADAPDGIRCVVVRGRYEHVNFILDAAPRRVHVLDVAPPWPAKLVDQVQRVIDTAEDLPATECVPQVVDLEDLAAAAPAEHYLLACRGGGMSVPGAMISYLDEVPPEGDWTLLGCARSRAIHDHFYPDRAATLRQVDTCPIHLATTLPLPPGEARLTKCCLLEEHIETHGDTVVVPWGSSFALVAQGLSLAADLADRRDAELLDQTAGKGPQVSARITESLSYAHLWGTPEVRSVFDETERLQGWLDVLAALARAQAAEGQIPAESAEIITREARVERLDLARVAKGTRETGHSTLGLIHELRRVLPESARAHIYVGATVQDVTDTWTALAMRTVGGIAWRDLRAIETTLIDLATRYRDSLIAGRTHGQPGAPATFGWKVASWADETRRHLDRLREGARRWLVAQLGGGLGTLVDFGEQRLAVRARFAADLGLGDPGISWLSSRDRIAEFGSVLTMITGTLARIGGEVYELQRPEIGELGEPRPAGAVGSITMHHKRNPEGSEHLDTLARLTRANYGVLMESLVSAHERDGRAWKAEWVALPEVCLLTGAALSIGRDLLDGLEVNVERMAANVGTYLGATQNPSDTGAAGAMVDFVVDRARRARAEEAASWP